MNSFLSWLLLEWQVPNEVHFLCDLANARTIKAFQCPSLHLGKDCVFPILQRPETEVQCSVCEHPNVDEVQVMKDTIMISIMAKWSTLQGQVN